MYFADVFTALLRLHLLKLSVLSWGDGRLYKRMLFLFIIIIRPFYKAILPLVILLSDVILEPSFLCLCSFYNIEHNKEKEFLSKALFPLSRLVNSVWKKRQSNKLCHVCDSHEGQIFYVIHFPILRARIFCILFCYSPRVLL